MQNIPARQAAIINCCFGYFQSSRKSSQSNSSKKAVQLLICLFQSGSMLTMTHSTSQHRSPQESPTHLPDEGLLGIPNGVDTMSLQDEDDDITEPIAPCTSLTPSLPREPPLHQNGGGLDSSSMTELSTSEIPEGISCQPLLETAGPAPIEDIQSSIIDQDGYSLEEFILYVRNKTRNGLFDQYQEIKSRPPDGTFDHARMTENLVKVNWICVLE